MQRKMLFQKKNIIHEEKTGKVTKVKLVANN